MTGCADRKNEGRQRRTNGAGGWSHHRDGRTAASGRTAAEKVDLGFDTMLPEMERETIERERPKSSSQQQVDKERAHGPHGPRVYGPRYILNKKHPAE